MTRAHGLLTRQRWDGANLADIVRGSLQPYGEAVIVDGGSDCPLRARDALNLALVVHELATNAAKHGALSVAGGKVEVCWKIDGKNDDPRVHLVWQEKGGPPVSAPTRQGFGSRLIQGALPKVELRFDPQGLRCEVKLKLRLRAQARKWEGPATQQPTSAEARVKAPLRGLRIIIVEDDPLTALQLESALENAGAEIAATASTLHEAMGVADDGISAAVLDVNLDGEMSFAVAERLMARKIPIVCTTGYDAAAVLPEHLRSVPTLQKPVNTVTLVHKLAELTRRSERTAGDLP